jgi:hypothetical protein
MLQTRCGLESVGLPGLAAQATNHVLRSAAVIPLAEAIVDGTLGAGRCITAGVWVRLRD